MKLSGRNKKQKTKKKKEETQGDKSKSGGGSSRWPQVELRNLAESKLFLVPEMMVTLDSIPM
jgi:hypothetical protein